MSLLLLFQSEVAAGTGSASMTLGALTCTATGTLAIQGSSSMTLEALTCTATGVGASAITGSASVTLDALTCTATGTLAITGSASMTLGALTLSADGGEVIFSDSPDVVVRIKGSNGVAQGNAYHILNTTGLHVKDPSDVLVYHVDWGAELLDDGTEIATSSFTVTSLRPTGDTALTADQAAIKSDGRQTQIRLTSGTVGARYRIDNQITTDEDPGQTYERSFQVKVEQQ